MDTNNAADTTATSVTETTETTTTTAPAAPAGPTKAELRAAELKARREAKAAAKEARKAELAAKRADGIIGTLKNALDTAEGTSRKEILAVLTTKFPDRDPIGMAVTVGIQLSRLAKTTGRKIVSAKVDGRDRVYGFADKVRFPAIVVEGTPTTAPVNVPGEGNQIDHPAADAPATTTNETLSEIGSEVTAAAATTEPTPEPTPEAPKGKGKGGKKNGGKK